ncbi:putative transcription factor B3-Domain family [Helianthus anomalus]
MHYITDTYFIVYIVMAPAFVKIIYDASPSSLPLPPFYNDAVRNLGFHVGHVTLRTGSQLWHVYIKVTTNGCFITDGWSNVFTDLGIEETDFIFFEVLPENTIYIYHFKIDRDLDPKDKFYHVMMFPEAKNLVSFLKFYWLCYVYYIFFKFMFQIFDIFYNYMQLQYVYIG